jgi:hypothetical protein
VGPALSEEEGDMDVIELSSDEGKDLMAPIFTKGPKNLKGKGKQINSQDVSVKKIPLNLADLTLRLIE